MSRTTTYTGARAERVCIAVAEGKTVRQVCLDEGMSLATFFRWLRVHEDFAAQYRVAKEIQVEALVDEMLEIADEAHDKDSAMVARVRIDTRKWLASKLMPKKYGERQQMELTGADGGPLLGRIEVELVNPPEGGHGR